jgi:hypothetical protein
MKTVLVVIALLTCWGCSTSPEKVRIADSWIQRRTMLIETIHGIEKPMTGTSYDAGSVKLVAESAERIEKHRNPAENEKMRELIEGDGRFAHSGDVPGIQFDLEVSDALLDELGAYEVGRRINHHYARRLEAAGWYITGFRSTDDDGGAISDFVWTDFGDGRHVYSADFRTITWHVNANADAETQKGYFELTITVRVNPDSRTAHVSMSGSGVIARGGTAR